MHLNLLPELSCISTAVRKVSSARFTSWSRLVMVPPCGRHHHQSFDGPVDVVVHLLCSVNMLLVFILRNDVCYTWSSLFVFVRAVAAPHIPGICDTWHGPNSYLLSSAATSILCHGSCDVQRSPPTTTTVMIWTTSVKTNVLSCHMATSKQDTSPAQCV